MCVLCVYVRAVCVCMRAVCIGACAFVCGYVCLCMSLDVCAVHVVCAHESVYVLCTCVCLCGSVYACVCLYTGRCVSITRRFRVYVDDSH